MNNITSVLEASFKAFAADLNFIMKEAKDIDAAYFSTDASSKVSGLGSGSDGAAYATKLTKTQYQNGIGYIEQLNNFFSNAAVTTGDYLNNIDNLIYGNAVTPVQLSEATENLANRLKVLAQSSLTNFLRAKDILALYYNSELSVIVAGTSGARIVYGATMTVSELTSAITLVEQFKNMINNQAVSTGSYGTNVAIWLMVGI